MEEASVGVLHIRGVRGTYFGNHEGLDTAGMRDMRSDAKVDHGTTAIDGGGGAIGDFSLDEVLLVFVVLRSLNQHRVNEPNSDDRTWNISSRSSFDMTRRSNFCFSLTAFCERVSRFG